ncbi:MAG: Chemotaxis protein CheV [Myxococcales bacterium]|nr:Chemotaxis protein CheV [Myxococcales bacterium]
MSGSHGSLPLVLVVEDFEELYELYSDFLAGAGYAVEGTNNGVEAVEECRRTLPDLVLMDLALPRMNGWEAIELLKSEAATRHIPIIALTGHVKREYADLARKAGADAVLLKPCPLNQLLGEVERLLGRHAPSRHP